MAAFSGLAVTEELPVVGEGEPWAEPEFLGEYFGDDEDSPLPTDSDGIIEYRDGVFRLNTEMVLAGADSPDRAEKDPDLRALVDSVLSGDQPSS